MVKLVYTKTAFADLRSIKKYIAQDSLYYAQLFMLDLTKKIDTLIDCPEIGRYIHPERYKLIKQILHKSYRIIYCFENNTVTIISIHHQSRLLENIDTLKQFEI